MSILAEPRRKQRISIDPNNLQWRDNDNKVSKKLMEKMGWSDGKGLGKNNHGNVDAVKLKANYSGKGLGADKLAGYDSTWIGHHDDFADLLAALNKNKPAVDETEEEKKERTDKISIELSSKSVRRRIHYQKFTRMKDTANYSEKDKSAVLGLGLKRTKDDAPEIKKESSSDSEGVNQGNTTVSNVSVGDYFAAKMAALKAKSMTCAVSVKEVKEEVTVKMEAADDYEENTNYACIGFSYDEPVKKEIKEEEEEEEDEKAKKKREKKQRKEKEANKVELEAEATEEIPDEEAKRQRRKEEKRQRKLLKKQQEAENNEEVQEQPEEEQLTEKQRRKLEKRLRKMKEAEEATEQATFDAAEEETEVKKSKKKRDRDTVDDEQPSKKKKRQE